VVFEGHRPVRVISVVQDISARKHAEAELKESETRLRLAREAAGFGIWDWDLVTGAGMWSPDQWRLWGMQPRPGAPSIDEWEAAIHNEDRAQQAAAREAVFAGKSREVEHEFRVVWPDGQVRWLLVKATLLRNPHGHLVRIAGITLDVTPSRQAEADLRRLSAELRARMDAEVAAREAAQARAAQAERMHALGQLAGGIAHDFNNVLQTVSGTIALIAHHPDDQVAIRRLVGLAEAATRRGAAITSRLLVFSRGGEPASEPVAAADLLHDLCEILAHTLGPNIDIAIRLGSGLAPFIADRSQLETSLINLATNARDAMPQGGSLTFFAAVETVPHDAPPHEAGLAPGCYMRLGVADTGTGMDDATRARATEPFFTTKPAGVGTGLGLAMAKDFAVQSGGGMTIESSPGGAPR
jgi:PAS domain S-box-containing protein